MKENCERESGNDDGGRQNRSKEGKLIKNCLFPFFMFALYHVNFHNAIEFN